LFGKQGLQCQGLSLNSQCSTCSHQPQIYCQCDI